MKSFYLFIALTLYTVSCTTVRNRVYTLSDVSPVHRPFQCSQLTCSEDCKGIAPSCAVDKDTFMECIDARFQQGGKTVGHCYPRFIKYYVQKEFAQEVTTVVGGEMVTCERPTFSLVVKSDDQYKPPAAPLASVEFLPLLLCYNIRRISTAGSAIGGQKTENDYTPICDSLVDKLKRENPAFFTAGKFNLDDTVAKGYMGVIGRKPNEILKCFKDGAWGHCSDPTLKGTALNCRLWANIPGFF